MLIQSQCICVGLLVCSNPRRWVGKAIDQPLTSLNNSALSSPKSLFLTSVVHLWYLNGCIWNQLHEDGQHL